MGSKGVSAVLSADGVIALDIDALVPGGLGAWIICCQAFKVTSASSVQRDNFNYTMPYSITWIRD
ncbi:hypothetical protein DPV78_000065 [Talaromyces pinophilus]|nr:hypothetical protein DPV78_000065 [Talaromyces pinophilus]